MKTDTRTVKKRNSKDAAISDHQEDILCVEGSTQELCENPEYHPVIDSLKDLKDKFIRDVRDISAKYNLDGSVKVVFSIYTRKSEVEEIGSN